MARYSGPVCRLCRREGMKLFLKGERCYTEKCAIEKRNFPPGSTASAAPPSSRATACSCARSSASSGSTACSRSSSASTSSRPSGSAGITGEVLLQLLERRLDNVVYRLGLATSRPQARELVRHGHFAVNGRKVNIPSFLVKAGDTVARARPQPEERDHPARDGRGQGARRARVAAAAAPSSSRAASCRCRRARRSTCPSRSS